MPNMIWMFRSASEDLLQAEQEKVLANELQSFRALAGDANAAMLKQFMASASAYELQQERYSS